MSKISSAASALSAANAKSSHANIVTKDTLQSELIACRERSSKLDTLIEDMMFDEIDGTITRTLQLTQDLFMALHASSQSSAADTIRSGALALATRAGDLIRAGESIQNDPDNDSATSLFVEISEKLPSDLASHLGAVERDLDLVVASALNKPAAPTPAPAPVSVPAPTPVVDKSQADDEAKARNQKLLEQRAAASPAPSSANSDLKSAGLNAAEKAEEERLLRAMQRKGPSTPGSRIGGQSPVASPATTPQRTATPVKSDEVPAWKKRQEEERIAAEQLQKKQQEEAQQRAERAKQAAAAPAASPSPAASSPVAANLSVSAAKAEEERLARTLNRRSGHSPAPAASTPPPAAASPAPVTPTASPAPKTAAAATASPASSGVPEWKRRQQERDRELAEKAKEDEATKSKAAESVLANAEVAQREREAARAAASPSGESKTWEPKPRKQTMEQVATELGAQEAMKLMSPSGTQASVAAARFDDVRCAGCNVMIVGGYKNALGKCWHKECWKCVQCQKPLETKFANVGGKPMCVPCATERAKKAKASQ